MLKNIKHEVVTQRNEDSKFEGINLEKVKLIETESNLSTQGSDDNTTSESGDDNKIVSSQKKISTISESQTILNEELTKTQSLTKIDKATSNIETNGNSLISNSKISRPILMHSKAPSIENSKFAVVYFYFIFL